jgi:thiamine biosynthesis lipoprotein
MKINFNGRALGAGIVLLGVVALGEPAAALEASVSAPEERAELVMGTTVRIAILDGPRDPATYEAGFGALRTVDRMASLYRGDSALVRVNAHAGVHAEPVEEELFALLVRARELSVLSDGAFDPTVLPLLRAWGAYGELRHLGPIDPSAVGFAAMLLDPSTRSVRFALPGMALDLGGIAKGWALDRARAALAARGVRRALLDLGGTLACVGGGGDQGWPVAVRDPEGADGLLGIVGVPDDGTISTSANYARDFDGEGWRARSHIYDPRTRRPVLSARAVTVWAPEAAAADALSTALFVLGPQEAKDVLARFPDAGALFAEGGEVRLLGRAPLSWRALEPLPRVPTKET